MSILILSSLMKFKEYTENTDFLNSSSKPGDALCLLENKIPFYHFKIKERLMVCKYFYTLMKNFHIFSIRKFSIMISMMTFTASFWLFYTILVSQGIELMEYNCPG